MKSKRWKKNQRLDLRQGEVNFVNMNKFFPAELKAVFMIPIGLGLVLIPFSLFIGWNLFTVVMFWFVIVPCVALFLTSKASKKKFT